jgi:hypothetical protein
VQNGFDNAHRCFDLMLPGTDAAYVGKCCDQSDHSMTAHSQIADIVKENHSGNTSRIYRLTKKCAHKDIRAAWFVDNSGAKVVVALCETMEAIRESTQTQIRSSLEHDSSRFTRSVRVDYLDIRRGHGSSVKLLSTILNTLLFYNIQYTDTILILQPWRNPGRTMLNAIYIGILG